MVIQPLVGGGWWVHRPEGQRSKFCAPPPKASHHMTTARRAPSATSFFFRLFILLSPRVYLVSLFLGEIDWWQKEIIWRKKKDAHGRRPKEIKKWKWKDLGLVRSQAPSMTDGLLPDPFPISLFLWGERKFLDSFSFLFSYYFLTIWCSLPEAVRK